MAAITQLTLDAFRNYDAASLEGLRSGFVVLTGSNGAGKTNILEAISLFSPGRGLRNAKMEELTNQAAQENQGWTVAANIEADAFGSVRLGTSLEPGATKRRVFAQGVPLKAQSAFVDYLSVIWLTPQMDGLFLGGASERRRFFDRMIFAFDPAHAGRLTRYENAMRQRARVLQESGETGTKADAVWLSGLEGEMSEAAIAITASRYAFMRRLNQAMDGFTASKALGSFPAGRFVLEGLLASWFEKSLPAIEMEDRLRVEFEASRAEDARRGGAREGAHKSDMAVFYAKRNMPAAQCSTGEQKALLTGLVLAFAMMVKDENAAAPILLLDEIAAHFDAQRRADLFDLLEGLEGQVWMTGTDEMLFEAISPKAQHLKISNGQISF